MAFSNIAGLAQNISSSIVNPDGSFNNPFSKRTINLYPKDGGLARVVSEVNELEGNWNQSFPYSFSVRGEGGNRFLFSEFILPINPQELSQKEKFAIRMKATQGGTSVNNNGNKYKDLVISGTTGIHPRRGSGGASSRTGKAIGQPDDLAHSSGYAVFQHLRNYFKSYYEYKKLQKSSGKNFQLQFNNFKDGEFLKVELIDFDMKRAASNGPRLYNYTITMKVLGVATRPAAAPVSGFFKALQNFDEVMNTAVDYIDTARGIFLRSTDILNQISSTYESTLMTPLRKAALAGKAFTGLENTLADFGPGLIRTTVSAGAALAILLNLKEEKQNNGNDPQFDPRLKNLKLPNNPEKAVERRGADVLTNFNNGIGDGADASLAISLDDLPRSSLDAFDEEVESALDLPREFYENAIAGISSLEANANDKFNLGDTFFDQINDRTNTLSGDAGKIVTDREFEVLYAFSQALKGLRLMIATTALFKSGYTNRINDTQEKFNNQLSILAQPAVKEVTLSTNTDLERLALTELGDVNRWIEIAELNDLKPPYIIQDTSDIRPNVLYPGDTILIPQPIINGFGTTPQVKELPILAGLNAAQKNLGIDIALTKEFDIELTNSNDFAITFGIQNAIQAILIKLNLEQGELLDHPTIGVGLVPGTKGNPANVIRRELLETLSDDPRFSRITDLQIVRENSTLFINFSAFIQDVDTPVPVSLKFPG